MAGNQCVYESMFILDSNQYARDPGGVSGQIAEMVEKSGGEVLASRLWNEQRLAYPIEGHRKGTYWLTYFRMDTDKLTTFNRACQLNESVLRNLTLKVDPRLVDTLVAHARGERLVPEEETAETTPEPVPVPAEDSVTVEGDIKAEESATPEAEGAESTGEES